MHSRIVQFSNISVFQYIYEAVKQHSFSLHTVYTTQMFTEPKLMFIFKSREKRWKKWKVDVLQSKLNRRYLYMKIKNVYFAKAKLCTRAYSRRIFCEKGKNVFQCTRMTMILGHEKLTINEYLSKNCAGCFVLIWV